MDAATVFTLIIVTFGGDVKLTQGIVGLSVCDEAASVAVWGETRAEFTEELKKIDKQIQEESERISSICNTLPEGVACRPGVKPSVPTNPKNQLLTTADPKFAKCVIEPSATLKGHP